MGDSMFVLSPSLAQYQIKCIQIVGIYCSKTTQWTTVNMSDKAVFYWPTLNTSVIFQVCQRKCLLPSVHPRTTDAAVA